MKVTLRQGKDRAVRQEPVGLSSVARKSANQYNLTEGHGERVNKIINPQHAL